jgi:hypothetical protein
MFIQSLLYSVVVVGSCGNFEEMNPNIVQKLHTFSVRRICTLAILNSVDALRIRMDLYFAHADLNTPLSSEPVPEIHLCDSIMFNTEE